MLKYSITACILSVVLFSSFFNSEAFADPEIYTSSPTVALEETLYIVYSDSSRINDTPNELQQSRIYSVDIFSGNFEKSNVPVWLTEIGDTGNFTGALVKFTTGALDGNVPQVHAEEGFWVIAYIPQTSIVSPFGEVVAQVDLSQQYADMRFEPDYSDCDRDFGGDNDNDGICADWEKGDGMLRITYTGNPPNPSLPDYEYECGECDDFTKDIFLEIDFMQGHGPSQLAIDNMIDAFANSGVDNNKGIRLHVQLDDSDSQFIPHKYQTHFPGRDSGNWKQGFDQIKALYFGTESPSERGTTQNPNPNWDVIGWDQKRQAFHYMLFVHNRSQSTSSGIAEVYGNDVMISLGSFHGAVGNLDDTEGSMMHELGHNLDLKHGGDDDVNCKPNYLSVMSYSRQFDYFGMDRKLDFSKQAIGTNTPPDITIDEMRLEENAGIGSYQNNDEVIIFNAVDDTTQFSNTDVSCINWDPNTTCGTAIGQPHDIRAIKDTTGKYICLPQTETSLDGYDDWTALGLDSRGFGGFDDGAPGPNNTRIPEHRCLPEQANVPPEVALKFRACGEGVEDDIKSASDDQKGDEKVKEGVESNPQGFRELNYKDVQTMRVIQVDMTEVFIQNLPESAFVKNDKKTVIAELSKDFANARKEIRSDNIKGTINILDEIRKTIDEKIILKSKEKAKEKVTKTIDSHVKALQILDPTYVPLKAPDKQIAAGVSYDDIKCNRGLFLMVDHSSKDALCVQKLTGDFLQKTERWNTYEFPTLKITSEKQILK